jgi:hypothetical protein
MGYDTMPDNEPKQRARWDLYLLILSAIAMFFMAAAWTLLYFGAADGAATELS